MLVIPNTTGLKNMLIENSLDCFILKNQLKKNLVSSNIAIICTNNVENFSIFTNSQVQLSEELNATLYA